MVNPEHIAVALRYNDDEEAAPRVMAKASAPWRKKSKRWRSSLASRLCAMSRWRALHDVEIGEEIPEGSTKQSRKSWFVYQLEAEEAERRKRR